MHQTLEEADAQTDNGEKNTQDQDGMRADSFGHIANPADSGGEHSANGFHQSGNSHSISMQNHSFHKNLMFAIRGQRIYVRASIPGTP